MASEKRLIDVNEFVDTFWQRVYAGDIVTLGAMRTALLKAPTVDAEEVVRCKDCRWAREKDHREPTDTPDGTLICQCHMHHHIPAPWGARLAVKPDGFCDCGERK